MNFSIGDIENDNNDKCTDENKTNNTKVKNICLFKDLNKG
jgi:hypothetical protein